MPTITQTTPQFINQSATISNSQNTKLQQNNAPDEQQPPEKSIVVEITPGENNVKIGDKSQNTAEISITTPNRTVEFEISREQLFNVVERRTYKDIINQPLDNSGRKRVLAAALKTGEISEQEFQALVTTQLKKDQAQIYAAGTKKANDLYDTSSSSSSSSGNQSAENAYQINQARQAYYRQTFFFSTIDRIQETRDKIQSIDKSV